MNFNCVHLQSRSLGLIINITYWERRPSFKDTGPPTHYPNFKLFSRGLVSDQELRIAYMAQRPVNFPLECVHLNWETAPQGDAEWANCMVFHLAGVLNHCCGTNINGETHRMLSARCQSWVNTIPDSFTPVFYEPPPMPLLDFPVSYISTTP